MGKKCISIVVPMYNEQESLQILYRELNRVTREMGDYDFEYLFVNDGSKDAGKRSGSDPKDPGTCSRR